MWWVVGVVFAIVLGAAALFFSAVYAVALDIRDERDRH